MYDYNLIFPAASADVCNTRLSPLVLSKTPLVLPVLQVTVRLPHKLMCYLIFSVFCVMGTYFGLNINDSIAKHTGYRLRTRRIARQGPSVGLLVGFTGGLHRYSLGGMTAFSCIGVHYCRGAYRRPGSPLLYEARATNKLFNPRQQPV